MDLILKHKIPRVVVSNRDPNPKVAGQSIAKLQAAGVEVIDGILEAEGKWLNRAFFTWIIERRPCVILKWAQTNDGFIGKAGERTPVSGPAALRLVHRWRSETDAILIGTTTALADNPRLDTRMYFGKNPLRIVFDREGKIPPDFYLLDNSTETWVFGKARSHSNSSDDFESSDASRERTGFFSIEDKVLISNLLKQLYEANHAILLVEGGANVLQQFLENGYWDEIRVVENERRLGGGVVAPKIPPEVMLKEQFRLGEDLVRIFARSTVP